MISATFATSAISAICVTSATFANSAISATSTTSATCATSATDDASATDVFLQLTGFLQVCALGLGIAASICTEGLVVDSPRQGRFEP